MEHTTDTNLNFLVPESNYEAMITKILKKEIKPSVVIYEWHFEALVDEKQFNFKIGMFSSQMADLLHVLGAEEVSNGKFKWNDDEQLGKNLSFNVVHFPDKNGKLRATLTDIKLLS